jgi:hypothetical protein
MARPNKKGNSFMGLGLDEVNEKKFKELLEDKELSAKQYLRALIKREIKAYEARPDKD